MRKKGKRKDKEFYRGETTISIRFHFALISETLVLFYAASFPMFVSMFVSMFDG